MNSKKNNSKQHLGITFSWKGDLKMRRRAVFIIGDKRDVSPVGAGLCGPRKCTHRKEIVFTATPRGVSCIDCLSGAESVRAKLDLECSVQQLSR